MARTRLPGTFLAVAIQSIKELCRIPENREQRDKQEPDTTARQVENEKNGDKSGDPQVNQAVKHEQLLRKK